jgi:hypothetical protein
VKKAPAPSKTSAADIAARSKAPNVLIWWLASVIENDETPVMEWRLSPALLHLLRAPRRQLDISSTNSMS